MRPQQRGREFENIIASIAQNQGWRQEEGVRTSHEEIDVILFRDHDYYLVECKWVREPTGAAVIRELIGKLTNRANVRGIVISMSGFTGGAEQQVTQDVGTREIVLFGPQDVKSMISARLCTFGD